MSELPIVYNKRKAKCADCKIVLLKGEGIGEKYPMFHGTGQFFYLCPPCKLKRVAWYKQRAIEHEKELKELDERLHHGG